jgi:DNA-binding beta-propeller fold protein YncE
MTSTKQNQRTNTKAGNRLCTILHGIWIWDLFGLWCLGFVISPASAQQGWTPAKYPKMNVATGYTVDPKWPQKPAQCKFDEVRGIAVDAADNVYVFTSGSPPVQVYDADGKFLRGWGQDVIKSPHQIRIDPAGKVWVADMGRHIVQQYTPEGKLLRTLGTPDRPGADKLHFNFPTDMAVTPQGDIFVTDGYANARIVHFDRDGKYIKEWGELGAKPGQFSIPHSIGIDSKGRLYVADRNNVRIQVFEQTGKLVEVWNDLVTPWGLWVNRNDEIWICGSSPAQWAG